MPFWAPEYVHKKIYEKILTELFNYSLKIIINYSQVVNFVVIGMPCV